VKFSECISSLPIAPGILIFKLVDIDLKGKIQFIEKSFVYNQLCSVFSNQYAISAGINAVTRDPLTFDHAKSVLDVLLQAKSKINSTYRKFDSVSIDAEPIYSPKEKHKDEINTLDFITELVNLINTKLDLPVNLYISPAKLKFICEMKE